MRIVVSTVKVTIYVYGKVGGDIVPRILRNRLTNRSKTLPDRNVSFGKQFWLNQFNPFDIDDLLQFAVLRRVFANTYHAHPSARMFTQSLQNRCLMFWLKSPYDLSS